MTTSEQDNLAEMIHEVTTKDSGHRWINQGSPSFFQKEVLQEMVKTYFDANPHVSSAHFITRDVIRYEGQLGVSVLVEAKTYNRSINVISMASIHLPDVKQYRANLKSWHRGTAFLGATKTPLVFLKSDRTVSSSEMPITTIRRSQRSDFWFVDYIDLNESGMLNEYVAMRVHNTLGHILRTLQQLSPIPAFRIWSHDGAGRPGTDQDYETTDSDIVTAIMHHGSVD